MSTTSEASVPARPRIQRPWAALLLVLIILAASINCYRALWMRPALGNVFDDFGVKLPLITHLVMSPWFALTFPALAALAICLELFRYRHATPVNMVILVVIHLL